VIDSFVHIFLIAWIIFALFICLFVMARAQRNQLNKRVQALLDSIPPEEWEEDEECDSSYESNVIRIDPRTGTYRKM